MLREKINIWDRTLGLRFSALVPKIYYDNFEDSFLDKIEKILIQVWSMQEKYKKFESDNFKKINEAKKEIDSVYRELLKIVYSLNKADNNIYKFPTYDEWLNQFEEPNLFDFNWFVRLAIMLEENFSGNSDNEEEDQENSKKKQKNQQTD